MKNKKLILYTALLIVFIGALIFLLTSNVKQRKNSDLSEAPLVPPTDLPQVLGNYQDFISFDPAPRSEVSGKIEATGAIKGGYFFEGNVIVRILNAQMQEIGAGTDTHATTDWMTAGPVTFKTTLDFTNLPKGPGYVKIQADDPRDASERGDIPVKQILVPIIIK